MLPPAGKMNVGLIVEDFAPLYIKLGLIPLLQCFKLNKILDVRVNIL